MKLLFSTFLASCIGITKEFVSHVDRTRLKKMEKEDEDRAINVILVDMYGFKKGGNYEI